MQRRLPAPFTSATILIVDDDPANLSLLAAMLEREAYSVMRASSGESALQMLGTSTPDLILLDIKLQGIDGYETCRRLKAVEATRVIPVIFVSVLQETDDKLLAFAVGGVDYLVKPFRREEVLARVRTHLELSAIKRNLAHLVAERTQDLADSEARYRVLFEANPLAALVYDIDDRRILAANQAAGEMLGYASDQLLGQVVDLLMIPLQREAFQSLAHNPSAHSREAAASGHLQFCHRDGQRRDIEGVVRHIDYPGHRAQILMLDDVSDRREAEERLQQTAKEHQQQLRRIANYG